MSQLSSLQKAVALVCDRLDEKACHLTTSVPAADISDTDASNTLSSENGEITDESDGENDGINVLDSSDHEDADDDEESSHSILPPNQEACMDRTEAAEKTC